MRRALLALLVIVAASSHAATIVSSALTGRVLSANAPAAGVTITATSSTLQHARTTSTDARGRYRLDALPPGEYDVTFERKGLQSLTRRAVVELGRVARADARLEPSEDEESVTSTATSVTVAETTAITSHFSTQDLDRLPLPGDPVSVIAFAPENAIGAATVDDAPLAPLLGYEVVDEVTVLRGALPVELQSFTGSAVAARTRSGGEKFTLSVRDTYSDGPFASGHFFESASGGRIVPERLWFFAAGWSGDHVTGLEADGLLFKLTSQLGSAHNLSASHLESDTSTAFGDGDSDTTSIRYTGVFGPRTTMQAVFGRSSFETGTFSESETFGTAKLSSFFGSHAITAGASRDRDRDRTALFLADRWTFGNVTLDAGLRSRESDTSPRVAFSYDLHGDGRRAVVASYGEYDDIQGRQTRMTSVGFATAIGNSGLARADAMRRELGADTVDQLQLEARYDLFGRIDLGGSYVYTDGFAPLPAHDGAVWAGAQLPLGEQEIGATFVERYRSGENWSTDLALRYAVPFSRFGLTLGGDALDVFAKTRAVKIWIRARI